MPIQSQSRFLATLVAGGQSRTFQGFAGGNVTTEVLASRPPGAQYERKSGGEAALSDITLTVDYDPVGQHPASLMRLYRSLVGVEDGGTVSIKPLDRKGNPIPGEGDTYTGMISEVNRPESNTNEAGSKAELSITFAPSNLV
jgi:hypothetical protein